jgi:hypothetical protein
VIDAYLLFWDSKEAVIESWPSGVEWVFTMDRYENLFEMDKFNYQYDFNYQRQTIESHPIYASLVVDMIDDEDQRFTRNP